MPTSCASLERAATAATAAAAVVPALWKRSLFVKDLIKVMHRGEREHPGSLLMPFAEEPDCEIWCAGARKTPSEWHPYTFNIHAALAAARLRLRRGAEQTP